MITTYRKINQNGYIVEEVYADSGDGTCIIDNIPSGIVRAKWNGSQWVEGNTRTITDYQLAINLYASAAVQCGEDYTINIGLDESLVIQNWTYAGIAQPTIQNLQDIWNTKYEHYKDLNLKLQKLDDVLDDIFNRSDWIFETYREEQIAITKGLTSTRFGFPITRTQTTWTETEIDNMIIWRGELLAMSSVLDFSVIPLESIYEGNTALFGVPPIDYIRKAPINLYA